MVTSGVGQECSTDSPDLSRSRAFSKHAKSTAKNGSQCAAQPCGEDGSFKHTRKDGRQRASGFKRTNKYGCMVIFTEFECMELSVASEQRWSETETKFAKERLSTQSTVFMSWDWLKMDEVHAVLRPSNPWEQQYRKIRRTPRYLHRTSIHY